MKVTEHWGVYFVTSICAERCGWFLHPLATVNLPGKAQCCPRCGCGIEQTVGRMRSRTVERWFSTKHEVIGFEERRDASSYHPVCAVGTMHPGSKVIWYGDGNASENGKTVADCAARFNNPGKFGGFPGKDQA